MQTHILELIKRNSDGDYRCTEIEIRQMIRDASDEPQDFGLIEKFSINDIDSEGRNERRARLQRAAVGVDGFQPHHRSEQFRQHPHQGDLRQYGESVFLV